MIWRENDANRSSIDSQKPTTYIAHATALANEKIKPIDPPNSGPRDLDIMKYVPPPVADKNFRSRLNSPDYLTFDDAIRADCTHW